MSRKKAEQAPEDVSVRARWKTGGFFTIPNRVYDKWGPLLGINGFAVYCALARYANNDSNEAWMKQSTIAQHLSCSSEVVGDALADIVELGLADRETLPRTTGFGIRHTYTLLPVEDPQEGLIAPRLRRKDEGKAQRARQAEIEARLRTVHIAPPPDTSLPSTGNTSLPSTGISSLAKLEIPVEAHLKFRYNEDSLREEDSKRIEARPAPMFSLLPGKGEDESLAVNGTPSLTALPQPPPTAPAPPPTAGSSALAPVEWDDLSAAPDEARNGPVRFPDDVDGWFQALVWVTHKWSKTKFCATKPKSEQDKYWGQAKQHFQKGHSVRVLLERYQEGGWWWGGNAWKGRRPLLSEISATWGDWEQEPVPFGPEAPPPANAREEWKPVEVKTHTYTPEETARMRQKALQEVQRERERQNSQRQSAQSNGPSAVQRSVR